MSDYRDALTMREIDERMRMPKGSAFRAFKRIEASLREGRDYHLLRAVEDAAAIAPLRAGQRIYAGSVNVILLAPSARNHVEAQLAIAASTRE